MVETDSANVLDRGDVAPGFELPGTDGETHSLEDFDGYDAVLVVFTCNHCPYAEAKFDELNRLAAEYDDAAVVGINPNDAEEYPDDDFETMREYVEEGRIQYDAYLRGDGSVAAAYGATCTPDPFLLRRSDDGDGRFELAYHGRLDDALNPEDEPTEREMKAHIETVLAGEPVTAEFRPSRGCSIKWQPGQEPAYV